MPDILEDFYIKKIIQLESSVYFEFSVSQDLDLRFNYLEGNLYDFKSDDFNVLTFNFREILKTKIYQKDRPLLIAFVLNNKNNYTLAQPKELEFRVIDNNQIKWCKITVGIQRGADNSTVFYGKINDISVQKQREQEYLIAEARHQFANLASEIGVWDWDMVTNEVFYSSQSLKILELEDATKDIISNPEKWDERVHPEDRDIYFGNINDHFMGKTPFYETIHRVLCNGQYKWILDRGKVLFRDSNGKPLRIIGTHTDVTSQKLKEQKLQETLDLVTKQKSKLLNFAHIVSHNLNNHTGNLTSIINMYEKKYLEIEDVFPSLKLISNELSTTIIHLVELVKAQTAVSENKQELPLCAYLDKVISLLDFDIKQAKIKLINKISIDCKVFFEPAYLESILLNLTTNGIKYSDPQKQAIIEYYLEKEITPQVSYTILCVKDNGIGIDLDKYKDVIFGLYKTFHKTENSNGIGLYITKNQIEAMGGKIIVQSTVGKGSVFKVYFKN